MSAADDGLRAQADPGAPADAQHDLEARESTANDTANDREDGAALVSDIVEFLCRYVVFPSGLEPLAIALFVLHTHALAAAEATPYLLIVSAEKRSGKSRLLEVLELLVLKAWLVAGVTEAVLFRKIAGAKPTLLLDEVDAVFGTYAERTEPLRAVLNAGNRRAAVVSRCVGPHHDVRDFSVYCPKALAGIDSGKLPETVTDRSITIRLERKADEPVERFRYRKARQDADTLAERAARWADENLDALSTAEPSLPDGLDDRAEEAWEPLLAIADRCSAACGAQARLAALALSGQRDLEDESFGVQLLRDTQRVFAHQEVLSSGHLCESLKKLDDTAWPHWGKARAEPGIRPLDLARLLKPYGIKPRTVRLSGLPTDTAKGYRREQFEDAWRRYAPSPSADDDDA